MNSLIVDNAVLEPGKYLVTVSPNWNAEANQDEAHKTIFFEALCSEKLRFKLVDSYTGETALE